MPENAEKNFVKRIIARFLILVGVLIVIFGILSYALTRVNVSQNSEGTMSATGSLMTDLLDDHIKALGSRLDTVTSDPELEGYVIDLDGGGDYGAEKLSALLDQVCDSYPDVSAAWVASESSGVLIGNGGKILSSEEYGLKNKSWYVKYISGAAGGSGYICTGSGAGLSGAGDVITIIVPVTSGGNVYAFCGMEISPDSVFSVLRKYTFNSGSYPIVAYDSEVLYSGLDDKFDTGDRTLQNIISKQGIFSGSVDSYAAEEGGTVYYYKETGSVTGWNMIVLFDSNAINGNVYKNFLQQLIVLLCLAGLTIVFGMELLKKESSDLCELCGCVREIAAGNLNYRVRGVSEKTEIGAAALSLNKIADTLQAKNAVISSFDTTDILTGLNNRVSLYETMEDIIRTREAGRSRFAVMFIDLDNFKWINETLGHSYGDAVLGVFGRELKKMVFPVFRYSGDEFIILKEFDDDRGAVREVIEKLHACFDKPLEVINDNIYIKFSVGVSVYPDDDLTPDLLLRDAEMALNRAKASGKDRVAFYTNSLKDSSPYSKAALAHSITGALKNGELLLQYQPIISTKTCDIHGFEVLLRWNSPEFGTVPPTEFIDVAEESGAIVQIGAWIFESACRTLKQINETLNPDVIMSINVSPVQLRRDNYMEHIRRVIDITQVNPKNIQLEITESTLIDFTDSRSSVINEINDLGIALALDDFGTGYSSLNYLKNFPIKCLKIDKSFVDEINNNRRDYAITDSIIDLVHSLGICTVAEGIETVGQYNFLADMKCDYIQGFLMSKPLDENAAIEFVERYDALHKPDKRMMEENERKLASEREEQERLRKEQSSGGGDGGDMDDFVISE